MRPGPVALAIALLLASVLPAQAVWRTFVVRDVGTSARIGMGARVANDDAVPVLSIVCRPDGLAAMFDTGIAIADVPGALPNALFVAADGGEFDPFPVTAEPYNRGERIEMRLLLAPGEAMGLAEYVLGATDTIQVHYLAGDERVLLSFDNDSAPISIGAVLGECEGRGKAK